MQLHGRMSAQHNESIGLTSKQQEKPKEQGKVQIVLALWDALTSPLSMQLNCIKLQHSAFKVFHSEIISDS